MRTLILLVCVSLMLVCALTSWALMVDFENGTDRDWTVIQGDWEVKGGKYHQTDKNWTTAATNDTYNRSYFGDINWTDYTIEVDVTIDDPGDLAPIAGIFARVMAKTKDGAYYFFRIDTRPDWGPGAVESPNNNFAGEGGGKMEGGLDPKFIAMEENNKQYHLKVIAEGNHFVYYVDGKSVLDVVDDVDPFMSGAVGLGTFNAGASFDNFQVTGTGVPGAVISDGKLTVTWGEVKSRL